MGNKATASMAAQMIGVKNGARISKHHLIRKATASNWMAKWMICFDLTENGLIDSMFSMAKYLIFPG
jgi:hypothetical protein